MTNVEGILIAIMFREPLSEKFRFFDLTGDFKDEFKSLFESVEPISVVPGGQAPPEVPRYILQQNEEDKISEFVFSGLRFDFRFLNIKDFELDSIEKNLKSIQSILERFDITPFRIGVVLNGHIKMDDEFFLNKYITMDKIKDCEEVKFSYRDIIREKGYNLNKWVKYGGLNNDAITSFEVDINTMDILNLTAFDVFGKIVSQKMGEFIGAQ